MSCHIYRRRRRNRRQHRRVAHRLKAKNTWLRILYNKQITVSLTHSNKLRLTWTLIEFPPLYHFSVIEKWRQAFKVIIKLLLEGKSLKNWRLNDMQKFTHTHAINNNFLSGKNDTNLKSKSKSTTTKKSQEYKDIFSTSIVDSGKKTRIEKQLEVNCSRLDFSAFI